MKSKLLVAAIACLALGACNHDASSNKNKDEKKPAAEQSQGAQPAQQPGHTSREDYNQLTNLAADDQSHAITSTNPTEQHTSASEQDLNKVQQELNNKLQDTQQDVSNPSNQLQSNTQEQPSSTEPATQSQTGATTDLNATQAPAH